MNEEKKGFWKTIAGNVLNVAGDLTPIGGDALKNIGKKILKKDSEEIIFLLDFFVDTKNLKIDLKQLVSQSKEINFKDKKNQISVKISKVKLLFKHFRFFKNIIVANIKKI